MDLAGIRTIVAAPSLPRFAPVQSSPESEEPADTPRRARPRDAGAAKEPNVRPSSPVPERMASKEPLRSAPKGLPSVAAPEKPTPPEQGRPATPAIAIQRIVDAAGVVRLEKCAHLRIALSPEHLGDLLIDLSWTGGALQGTVVAESGAAKELIESHLDQLRARLEGRGIPLGEFRVRVGVVSESPEPEVSLRSHRRQLLDVLA